MSTHAGDGPPSTASPLRPPLLWAALFFSELLLAAVLAYPASRNLNAFAFGDFGANLAAQSLIDDGLTPAVDFGAIYGLAPLAIGRAWLAAFGRTPGAFLAVSLAVNALIALLLGRIVIAARPDRIRQTLLVVLVPITFVPIYGSFAHALEALLLVAALERLASGSRSQALALCAGCVFAKQSMAVVLGAAVSYLILVTWVRTRPRTVGALIRPLLPAIGVALTLAALLSAYFSPAAVLASLSPGAGAKIYENHGFGFFREGRNFWAPAGAGPGYYLGTFAGTWLLATLLLAIGGLLAGREILRRRPDQGEPGEDVCVATLFMHSAFILFFFGTAGHWRSYASLLPLGLIFAPRWKGSNVALMAVILMAMVSYRTPIGQVRDWRTLARSPGSASLFAGPAILAELERVRVSVKGTRALFLHRSTSAGLFFPEFAKPVALYLDRGAETPGDLRRTREAIEGSDVVVVTKLGGLTAIEYDVFREWPEFLDHLPPADPSWSGQFFRIYRRPTAR